MSLSDSIRLKLERAHEHFDFLESLVVSWQKPHAYRFVTEIDDDPNEPFVRYRYVLRIQRPLPKKQMSQVLGDAIHNYRCVLDHLVWELSIAESGDPPPKPRRIAFPSEVSGSVPYGLHAVSPAVVTEIKRLFNDCAGKEPGAPSPFWMLCELSNVDKHSSIHVVYHYARSVHFEVSPTIIGTRIETFDNQTIEDDATTLAIAVVPRPMWNMEVVEMRARTEHGIAIAATSRTPLAHLGMTLEGIRDAVEEAAKRLGNLLP